VKIKLKKTDAFEVVSNCQQLSDCHNSDRSQRVVSIPSLPKGREERGILTSNHATPTPCQQSDTDNNRTLNAQSKFQILHRDNFKCRYCGAMPGSDQLEVDHLIPVSRGGSDSPLNLVAACKKCNRGRSDHPLFPHEMILGTDDEGWDIVKRWGVWCIKACEDGVTVTGSVYGNHNPLVAGCEYWFEIERAYESDWDLHIKGKGWPLPHKHEYFLSCLEFAREVTVP
jgi:5-methylcytosine-specific restriction endonuclease McrA